MTKVCQLSHIYYLTFFLFCWLLKLLKQKCCPDFWNHCKKSIFFGVDFLPCEWNTKLCLFLSIQVTSLSLISDSSGFEIILPLLRRRDHERVRLSGKKSTNGFLRHAIYCHLHPIISSHHNCLKNVMQYSKCV